MIITTVMNPQPRMTIAITTVVCSVMIFTAVTNPKPRMTTAIIICTAHEVMIYYLC